MNEIADLNDAWNRFCIKHGLNMYEDSENKKPISKAFVAGYLAGIGGLDGWSE